MNTRLVGGSRMAWPTRSSLVFLSLLVLWTTGAAGSSPTAMAPAPVRVGVVLDLRSDVGRERRACVSKALHDFDLKHPSYARRVELLFRDSQGDNLDSSTHAGQIIRSPLSKIVVVIWCFVVLILVQSYTASLSSILTAKMLRPGVKDLDQLRKNGDFVGYQTDSFVGSYLNISESRLRNYTTKEEYADALRLGSKNGGVSAIVDEIPYKNSFLSDRRYKNDFRMVGSLFKTPGFGFAFRLGSPLVHNLSIAILILEAGKEGSQIEVKWFGTSSSPIGDGTVPGTDSGPLTFQSFSGLFVITGSISSLMLLISIARWVYAKYTGSRSVSYSGVDEDSVLLQNGMGDNLSPDQQSLSEVDDDNLRGENAREGAPGPVQQNGMHSGSGIQIEMRSMRTI